MYEATEGEDSEVQVCAEIFNGTLETTVAVPFTILQTVGMYKLSITYVYSKNFSPSNLMNIGTIESELNVSSWFVTFTSGQSHKSNSISCITVFIGNDTNLGNTESFVLMFAAANRINYVPSKSKVNITINEDPMDGMQRNCVYNTIHYVQKIYFFRCRI